MGDRLARLEFHRHHGQWFWRFVAKNGRELARSSETYVRRVDCVASAALTLGVAVADDPGVTRIVPGAEHLAPVAVGWFIDEGDDG